LGFRGPTSPSGNLIFRLYNTLNDFHSHKWVWDADSLCRTLRSTGFTQVAEMAFRETRIEGLEALEAPTRVLHGEGICVEGVKAVMPRSLRAGV
jgi:hypothetical protein